MVEYHIDLFEQKPIEAHRRADGVVQYTNTGDDLIDEWERKIADGEDIDLLEAFDEAGVENLKKLNKINGTIGVNPTTIKTMQDVAREANETAEKQGLTSSLTFQGDKFTPFGR